MRSLFLQACSSIHFASHVPAHAEQTRDLAVFVGEQLRADLDMHQALVIGKRAISISQAVLVLRCRRGQCLAEQRLIVRMDTPGELLQRLGFCLAERKTIDGILDPQESTRVQVDLPRADTGRLRRDVESIEQHALLLRLTQQQIVGLHFVGDVSRRAHEPDGLASGVPHDAHVRLHVPYQAIRTDETITIRVARLLSGHCRGGGGNHLGVVLGMHHAMQEGTVLVEAQMRGIQRAQPVLDPYKPARARIDFPGGETGSFDGDVEALAQALQAFVGQRTGFRLMKALSASDQPGQCKAREEAAEHASERHQHRDALQPGLVAGAAAIALLEFPRSRPLTRRT